MLIRVRVNGQWRQADCWPGASLLGYLRDGLHLQGTKNACEQGECGSCSVWLNDEVVCACLVLAAQADGGDVTTIEALGGEDAPGLVQRAFVEAGAVQCGFCTPGLIVAADDLLRRVPRPADGQIREALAGNLCRCTGYEKILDAVRLAAARKPGGVADGGAG
jgi:aerobic carbon-monoxide dehydrogenase small subunit